MDPSYSFISGELNFLGSPVEVMVSKNGVSEIVPARLLLTGSLTPCRLERIASLNSCISLRIVEVTCRAWSVEEIC